MADEGSRAFEALKDEFLWPFDATWVRQAVHRAMIDVGDTGADPDALLERLAAHWRAAAAEAAPRGLSLEQLPTPDGYREPSVGVALRVRLAPRPPIRSRMSWMVGLAALVGLLALLAKGVTGAVTAGFGGYGVGDAWVSCGCCCVGPLLLLATSYAIHRLLRRQPIRELVRRGAHWSVDGTPRGPTAGALVDIRYEGDPRVVVVDESGTEHLVYRATTRKEARIAAICFEHVLEGRDG